MDPTRLMTQECTITPRTVTGTDDMGNDTLTEGTPATESWFVEPRSGSEDTGAENIDVATFNAYGPPDTIADDRAKLTVAGVDLEFVGDPRPPFWNPRSRQYTHVQASLKAVT